MARTKKIVRGSEQPRKQPKHWLWFVVIFGMVWYLTGFPFAFIAPEMVEVRAMASAPQYGNSGQSWHEEVVPQLTDDLIAWAKAQGVHESTLAGAVKAASLERNIATGRPEAGTGKRVDLFTILGITSIESELGGETVDPTTANPTGGCIAWWELLSHRLLNGPKEVASLTKIAEDRGLKAMEIYGSCGGGAIGWTQGLPSNWWSLMGPGFNPWSRVDAPEFTARYLTVHGYFTNGQQAAIRSYNPKAEDWEYLNPIMAVVGRLETSFSTAGLDAPTTTVVAKDDEEPATATAELTPESAKGVLEELVGIPYKDFGYRYDGQWVTWKGGEPAFDNIEGYNCGGFVLSSVEDVYGPVSFDLVAKARSDRDDPSGSLRSWFGYDEVMNIGDSLGGSVLKVPEMAWQEGSGYLVTEWPKLEPAIQPGRLYLATVSRPDEQAGRLHHHVVTLHREGESVAVYEATNYLGSGVQKISLTDLQQKYINLHAEYGLLVVELPTYDGKKELSAETQNATVSLKASITQWSAKGPRGSWEFNERTLTEPLGHSGEDTLLPVGTPLKAPAAGRVVLAEWYPNKGVFKVGSNKGFGYSVWIEIGQTLKGEPIRILLGHMSEIHAKKGQWVNAGDVVGLSGNSGGSTAPHVHTSIRIGGGICYGCTDETGSWWDGHWEDPDDWIGTGKEYIAIVPNGSVMAQSGGATLRPEITTLTVRKTPVLETALWLGDILETLDEGIQSLKDAQGVLGSVKDAAEFAVNKTESLEELNKAFQSVGLDGLDSLFKDLERAQKFFGALKDFVDLLVKMADGLDRLHGIASRWAIGGQPRDLGFDPSLDWRLFPQSQDKK